MIFVETQELEIQEIPPPKTVARDTMRRGLLAGLPLRPRPGWPGHPRKTVNPTRIRKFCIKIPGCKVFLKFADALFIILLT